MERLVSQAAAWSVRKPIQDPIAAQELGFNEEKRKKPVLENPVRMTRKRTRRCLPGRKHIVVINKAATENATANLIIAILAVGDSTRRKPRTQ
jgi:hypothetical protein